MRIMVLNTSPRNPADTEHHERIEPLLRSYASPGTRVDLCYPDDDSGGAHGGGAAHLSYYMSAPATVRKAVWAEQNGYDAVVRSNNFDPGIEAARLAVRIPVIGPGRTSLHIAASLSDRIGITVPLDSYLVLARRLLEAYGVLRFVTEIRSLSLGSVPSGDQVAVQRPALLSRAVGVMQALVRETQAECIVPLGGAIIPYIVAPADLEREVGAPVLNPVAIGLRVAEMCVQLGMSHSPLTYPLAQLSLNDLNAPAPAAEHG